MAILATVIYLALRTIAIGPTRTIPATLVLIWLYILIAGAPPSAIRAGVVATLVLVAGLLTVRSRSYTLRTGDALTLRFSPTLGEEPGVALALV